MSKSEVEKFLFIGGSLDGKFLPTTNGVVSSPVVIGSNKDSVTYKRDVYTKMNIIGANNRSFELFVLDGLGINSAIEMLLANYADNDTDDESDICVGSYVQVVVNGKVVEGRVCRTTHKGDDTVTSVAIDAPGVDPRTSFNIADVFISEQDFN